METKEICQKLNQFLDEVNWGGKHYIDLSLFSQAADRLEELEKQNKAMMKELCDKEDLVREAEGRFYELEKELDTLKNAKKPEPEWISVEDRLPNANYLVLCWWESHDGERKDYGLATFQSHGVWYVSNEGMPKVTHWMPLLEPPKPKEPTFKDVFLEKVPTARTVDDRPAFCIRDAFFYLPDCGFKPHFGMKCNKCWNQPYFESKKEGESGE